MCKYTLVLLHIHITNHVMEPSCFVMLRKCVNQKENTSATTSTQLASRTKEKRTNTIFVSPWRQKKSKSM